MTLKIWILLKTLDILELDRLVKSLRNYEKYYEYRCYNYYFN